MVGQFSGYEHQRRPWGGFEFLGPLEAAITAGTGAAATIPAGLAGLATLPQGPQASEDVMNRIIGALTYQPRSLEGQAATHALGKAGEVMEAPFKWAGEQTLEATGSPAAAAAAYSIPQVLLGGIMGRRAAQGPQIGAEVPSRFGQSGAVSPGQISTRFPTAIKATEDPFTHDLTVGLGSALADPEAARHNIGLMRQYENFPTITARRPERAIEPMLEHERRNLEFLHDMVPGQIRERSKLWYEGANRLANEASGRYGVPVEAAGGVYAALSPQKDWFMNVSLGNRVMDIIGNRNLEPWDSAMDATASRIGEKIRSPAGMRALENVRNKRLSDLTDPVDRALWIRLFDESHNDRSYQVVSPEGVLGETVLTSKGVPATAGWGSLNEISNAVSVLDNPSLENISRRMGQQHKVRNFYNNIVAPMSPRGDVTIDTHAIAAALLQPLAGKDVPVQHNFGGSVKGMPGPASSTLTGNIGTYGFHAEPYRRAAASRDILPREMQSITWEAVRGLFSNKSQAVKDRAKAIWTQHKRGKISQEQAQRDIMDLAGGIDEPAWYRSGR